MLVCSIILCAAYASSCRNQLNLCDPETYYWSEKTKAYFEEASVEEFIALPYNRQRALYSRLSPLKRQELWRAKVERVRSEGTLTDNEMKEFHNFIYNLSLDYFRDDNSDKVERRSRDFANMMQSKYAWDDMKVIEYLYSWLTSKEWKESIIMQSISMSLRGGIDTVEIDSTDILFPQVDTTEAKGCDCTSDNACVIMVGNPDCRKAGCEDSSHGCGFLGMGSCTGVCVK